MTEIFKNETFQEATRILTTLTNPVLNKSYELVATFDSKEQLMHMAEYGDIDQKINELRALIWGDGSVNSEALSSSIPDAPKLPQTPSKSQQFLNNNPRAKRVLPSIPSDGLPAMRKVPVQRNRQGSPNAVGQKKLATRTKDSIPTAPRLDPLVDQPRKKLGHSLIDKVDKRNVVQDIQQNIADARARRLALSTKQNLPSLQTTSKFSLIKKGANSEKLSKLLQEENQQGALIKHENLVGQEIRDKVATLDFDSLGIIVYQHAENIKDSPLPSPFYSDTESESESSEITDASLPPPFYSDTESESERSEATSLPLPSKVQNTKIVSKPEKSASNENSAIALLDDLDSFAAEKLGFYSNKSLVPDKFQKSFPKSADLEERFEILKKDFEAYKKDTNLDSDSEDSDNELESLETRFEALKKSTNLDPSSDDSDRELDALEARFEALKEDSGTLTADSDLDLYSDSEDFEGPFSLEQLGFLNLQ